jgi:hypothetical protein
LSAKPKSLSLPWLPSMVSSPGPPIKVSLIMARTRKRKLNEILPFDFFVSSCQAPRQLTATAVQPLLAMEPSESCAAHEAVLSVVILNCSCSGVAQFGSWAIGLYKQHDKLWISG